jgi:hypothetical protein
MEERMAEAKKINGFVLSLSLTNEETYMLHNLLGSIVGGGKGRQIAINIYETMEACLGADNFSEYKKYFDIDTSVLTVEYDKQS